MSDIITKFNKALQKDKLQMLKIWDIEYYENNDPSISDQEYDECLRIYNKSYKKPYVSSLGKANSDTSKFTHTYPVLSLDKITTREGYDEALKRFDYNAVIEPKLDGLTVVYYPDGTVVSRGDGHIGNVLSHVYNILPKPYKLPVRMEVVLSKKNRELYFKNNPKNSRNIAAGIVNRKEYSDDIKLLTYYAYNILGADNMDELTQLQALSDNEFNIPKFWLIDSEDSANIAYEKMESWSKEQPYNTDGIVVKANVPKKEKDFGATAHHPNNAIAYKFVSKVKKTTLQDIEWSPGRRKFTPVAIFEAIELGDSCVTRASLHNLNIINKLGIKMGSKVCVTLKNEIIPQIISCDSLGKDIDIPTKCPFCGNDLTINDSEELVCTNDDCECVALDTMNKIASKDGLDIVGLSEETIAKLFRHIKTYKNYNNAFDILTLTNKDFLSAGMTEYTSAKLLSEISKKKENVRAANFLFSCNIDGLGINTAKEIMKHYKDIDDFLNNWKDSGKEIHGIGEVTYTTILNNLDRISENTKYISSFTENNLYRGTDNAAASADSKVFVITGKLSQSKSYYKNLITNAGYIYENSVTKKTTYLVCADPNGSSSKLEKARKNDIAIVSEKELLAILEKKEGD